MESILKKKKISETPFRINVLEIINSSNTAVAMSHIENNLDKYNRITLYRTLKTFTKKGIIHPIQIAGKEIMYAMCEDSCGAEHQHNHLHLECKKCKTVSCVDVAENMMPNLSAYQIDSFEVYAKGICTTCKSA